MEEQTYDIELVDRYLNGSLGEEEKAAFESLIDSDEKLKKYVKQSHDFLEIDLNKKNWLSNSK